MFSSPSVNYFLLNGGGKKLEPSKNEKASPFQNKPIILFSSK
jgi:hypothetical protein